MFVAPNLNMNRGEEEQKEFLELPLLCWRKKGRLAKEANCVRVYFRSLTKLCDVEKIKALNVFFLSR